MNEQEKPQAGNGGFSRKIAIGLLAVSILSMLSGLLQTGQLRTHEGKPSLWEAASHAPHLVQIDVTGPISMESSQQNSLFQTDSMAVTARKALEKAEKDDSVKGVLLRIDSPGGTVGMSQELNAAVQRVREKKPVVATLGDLAASGGYYTACAADKIVANPGTLTGSIGVIISTLNFKHLISDKLGVQPLTVKSGKFKDILSPFRDPTPEDQALLQHMVNTTYQQFLQAVLDGRTRNIFDAKKKADISDKIKSIADGRVLVATEAVKMGLVDEVGDIVFARKMLDKMAKERFKLNLSGELPLEDGMVSHGLLDLLGLTSERVTPSPMTVNYPPKPMLMME